jgi:Tol biopolymer transport system component
MGDNTASQAVLGPAPEIFEPGVISGPANDGSPTFSPDGNTLFFTRSTAAWGMILESHKIDGRWSKPTPAPFSGEWPDSSPGMSPDGSFLVFVSIRPATPAGPGDKAAHRTAIAADGSLYFVSIDEKGGKRLYFSQYANGAYQQAQPLPFSDGTTADVDPEIAQDGSFLVFCSSGRRAGDPKDHLYLVLRDGTGWGPVLPIRYAGDDKNGSSTDDEPHLGPDHRTIYFSSDRAIPVDFPRSREQAQRDLDRLEIWDNSNSNVWFMTVTPWLKAGRITQ